MTAKQVTQEGANETNEEVDDGDHRGANPNAQLTAEVAYHARIRHGEYGFC